MPNEFTIGMTAKEVIETLANLHSQEINHLWFNSIIRKPPLEKRTKGLPSIPIAERLWDKPDPNENLIALYMQINQITALKIKELITRLTKNQILVLYSGVNAKNPYHLYLPLMDFKCRDHEINLKEIKNFLQFIQMPGVILNSGNSYHFYGNKILTLDQWLKFLGLCLLFCNKFIDFIDHRYIGHSLIKGMCSLRISANPGQNDEPKVVAVIN